MTMKTLGVLALLFAAGACRDSDNRSPSQRPVEKPTSSNMPEFATSSGSPSADMKGTGTATPQPAPSTTSDQGTATKAPTTDLATYDYTQRDAMASELRARLNDVDAKIAQLDARADAKSKRVANDLRVRRDQLSRDIDQISNQAQSDWSTFESRVSREYTEIHRDVEDSLR